MITFSIRPYPLALLCAVLGGAALPEASAAFLTPSFRGAASTEYSGWDLFTDAYTAPAGVGLAGEGNQPDLAGSTGDGRIYQTGTDGAFLVGGSGGGNIYSFSAPTGFTFADATAFTPATLVLQIRTLGTEIDYGSVSLTIGGVSYAPTFTREISREATSFGGSPSANVEWAAQWDLRPAGAFVDYTLAFGASGSSLSLDRVSVDTSSTFLPFVAVPEPGTGAIAFALFSLAALRGRWKKEKAAR